MLLNEIPNLEWSADLSRNRGVSTRCPFATVEACPRFYQSLSLLGGAGFTKLPEAEDERLLKYWKASDLWPRTDEQATSTFGESGNPSMFSNFCPEVTSDSFGLSATFLARYADEIDADSAHRRLIRGWRAGYPSWLDVGFVHRAAFHGLLRIFGACPQNNESIVRRTCQA